MRQFRFRLQRVLDVRLRQEEMARNELALRNRRLHEEEEKLADLEKRRAEADESFRERQKGPLGIDELVSMQHYRERLAHETTLQRTVVQLARERVETARAEVIEASKRKRALERLREKHKEEHLYEEERAEQRELDEQGNVLTQRRREEAS